MSIPAKVKRYLDKHRVAYQALNHSRTHTIDDAAVRLGVEPFMMLQTILLKDKQGLVSLVFPLDAQIDLVGLNRTLRRDLKFLPNLVVDNIFQDCEPGSHPPFGELYGATTILDKTLLKSPFIFFEPGSHTTVIRMALEDFQFLQANAYWTHFAVKKDVLGHTKFKTAHTKAWQSGQEVENAPLSLFSQKVNEIVEHIQNPNLLPPLPRLAQEITQFMKLKEPDIEGLSQTITEDLDLSQWLVQYANSSHFPDHPKIGSLYEAISQILGFNKACYIAFGLVASSAFQMQKNGPIGFDAFWRHAVLAAILAEKIASLPRFQGEVSLELVHGSALFHNFGLLLLGHLFGPEFRLLNKMVSRHPGVALNVLEENALGMGQAQKMLLCGHAQMGGWLMRQWQMPEEVVITAREHHNLLYKGPQQFYVDLIMIANQLLREVAIGDGASLPLSAGILSRLGLTYPEVRVVRDNLLKCKVTPHSVGAELD